MAALFVVAGRGAPWVASTKVWVQNMAMPTLGHHATIPSNKPGRDKSMLLDLKSRALRGKSMKEIWYLFQFYSCQ